MATTKSTKLLSDDQAIDVARKSARRIVAEGCRLDLEELEGIAHVEALRIVRQAAHTLTARREGLLYRSCRAACIAAIESERRRCEVQETVAESVKRETDAIRKAHSWAYVRREPIPSPNHITCYVWSFKQRGCTPEYLLRAISRLCSAQREAATLVFINGLTQQQAAARLGISQPSVSMRLASAAKKLRVFLRQGL